METKYYLHKTWTNCITRDMGLTKAWTHDNRHKTMEKETKTHMTRDSRKRRHKTPDIRQKTTDTRDNNMKKDTRQYVR